MDERIAFDLFVTAAIPIVIVALFFVLYVIDGRKK